MLVARLAALARPGACRRSVHVSLSGLRWDGVACGAAWRRRVDTTRLLCTTADETAPKPRRRSYRDVAKQGGGVAATRHNDDVGQNQIEVHARSFFVVADIDVDDLMNRLPPHWQASRGKNSTLLSLPAEDRTLPDGDVTTATSLDTYVSVFNRGAMVFLNCDFATYLEVFNLVKQANPGAVRPEYGEDCGVQISAEFPEWSQLRGEKLLLQELDVDNIAILHSVMAQTVILEYYERQVDSMLETVRQLNRGIERGDTDRMDRKVLYNALTRVNDVSIQVILSGLRNKFRPGTAAWKEEKYFAMQQLLWEQYELEERYEQLDSKVTYVTDVIKYALEVQKENKFLRLERMIVYLIMAELAVSLIHTPVSEALWNTMTAIADLFTATKLPPTSST